MRKIERDNRGTMKAGQDLVVAGYAGLAGTIAIVKDKKEELSKWFSISYLDHIIALDAKQLTGDFKRWEKLGACEWEPAGEGGILKSLWDLSGAYMSGIHFSLRKIPVKQETIEICERYELNPYRLFSAGCQLFTADNGGDLTEALKKEGIDAAVIGKVTGGIKRIIDHEESTGFLDRPTEDELYKVLPYILY